MMGKEIATCIVENVTILSKHEYIRHTLTSRCDVIGDAIIMKIILVDDLHTIFQNDEILGLGRTFSLEVSPVVEQLIREAKGMPYILSFWSTF